MTFKEIGLLMIPRNKHRIAICIIVIVQKGVIPGEKRHDLSRIMDLKPVYRNFYGSADLVLADFSGISIAFSNLRTSCYTSYILRSRSMFMPLELEKGKKKKTKKFKETNHKELTSCSLMVSCECLIDHVKIALIEKFLAICMYVVYEH